MTRFSRCPLCGSLELGVLFHIAGQGVDRCSTCSLVLLNPQPEYTDELIYAEEFYRGTCSREDGGRENVLEPDRVERRLESCRDAGRHWPHAGFLKICFSLRRPLQCVGGEDYD